MFKKIVMFYSVAVTAVIIGFFAGSITTKHRLMEQHRLELNAARERAAVLTDTITRAAETNRELGESLSRQRTSVAELRELISEVRTRYEKMEELLSCAWRDDSDAWNINSCVDTINGEQVE